MDTTGMTAHIARGMMLYTRMLNRAANRIPDSQAESAWQQWQAGTSKPIIALVVKQAKALAGEVCTAMQSGKIA